MSLYAELCEILGITINEFLAGEDISDDEVKEKSESNIMGVAKDSSLRQKKLKRVIAVLASVIIAAMVFGAGFGIYENVIKPQNYIYPLAEDSTEMQTAELFYNGDFVSMFKYKLKDEFSEIKVYASEYQRGKLTSKSLAGEISYKNSDFDMPSEGIIAVTPSLHRHGTTEIRVSDGASIYAANAIDLPEELGENLNWDEFEQYVYMGSSVSRIEEKTEIEPGKEMGIAAIIYDNDELRALPVSEIENENGGKENDLVHYFSIEFVK